MRSRFFFSVAFIAASCLLGGLEITGQSIGDRNRASTTGGASGSHTISGRVLFPDGRPATGITVTMSGGGFGNGKTKTDRNGAFSFIDLPKGTYSFEVEVEGYETERETFTIDQLASPNQGFAIAFHLRSPGQPKGAKTPTNPLLKGVPGNALAKYEEALGLIAKNDAKRAMTALDEALSLYADFAAAAYQKGALLLKENQLDKAIEAFVRAIAIKPDYLEAKYSFGYTHYLKKNFDIAAAVFEDVLKQKDIAEGHLYLGISLYQLKNVDAAESQLRLAVEARDDLAMGHLFLGSIYADKKRNSDAVRELQKYIDLLPNAPNAERIKTTIADLKKRG